jgi:leucyl-tRNA synthetase
MVNGVVLDVEAFKKWRPELAGAEFLLENGEYICGTRLEKMGKRFFNVVNPDDVVKQYGADSLRMYEMFLGPLEDNKPWNIQGIDGVHRFLKKMWKLYFDADGNNKLTDTPPTAENLKSLHQTIRKITDDLDKFTFNTCISAFMICVNDLGSQNCQSREILNPLLVLIAPFAPHIAEELWHRSGNERTVFQAAWPAFNEKYLIDEEKDYPISINGKTRVQMKFSLDTSNEEIEKAVLAHEQVIKWLEGKTPKKVIIVKGKIVNVVV